MYLRFLFFVEKLYRTHQSSKSELSDHEITQVPKNTSISNSSTTNLDYITSTICSTAQPIPTTTETFVCVIESSAVPTQPSKSITTTVMNLEAPKVLRLNSNSLILPSANILAVNGLQNTVINTINNPQTLLVNKPITVPTFILMQNNNLIPVCSVQHVAASQQRSQKLIVPKQSVMSTKTTFINKKPIPAICLYKSTTSEKDTLNKSANSLNVKRKKSKRSKGILVKYPKRKPPNKNKKPIEKLSQKDTIEPSTNSVSEEPTKNFTPLESCETNEKNDSHENDTFSMENCYSINETTFSENNDLSKSYSCSGNIFDTTDAQNTSEFGAKSVQFIDFFENSSTRSIENNSEAHSIESTQFVNVPASTCDKIEKSVQSQTIIDINFKSNSNFNEHLSDICPGNYSNGNMNCSDLESRSKESNELNDTREKNDPGCVNEPTSRDKNPNSAYHHLPTSCGVANESLLMKFIPSSSTPTSSHNCDKDYSQTVAIESNFESSINSNTSSDNELSKRKHTDKEITPLTIHCNLTANKSISKELSLSLMDEKKHYDNVSSFDEFSNDLFTSLQVPSSCQNTDSISPTAAFLLAFPLVSSCKNADLLPEHEHEDDSGTTTVTTSTTILQIGNLEPSSNLLFTSSKFTNRENQKSVEKLNFSCSKADDVIYSSTYCNNPISNVLVNDLTNSDNSVRKDKDKETCKENDASKYMPIGRDGYNFSDITFAQKNACVKDSTSVSQNMPFYTPSCTSSAFPSYNIFTKYNDIPPVTASYYSLGSQPFSVSKSVSSDPITDFNSWVSVPSIYNQEESKDKPKRDKCTSTQSFKNKNECGANISTFGLSLNDLTERPKVDKMKKPQKQNNARLVNWMTSPDLRNAPDTSQTHLITDNFLLQKDDSISTNTFLNSPGIANVQNNTAFGNASYSSSDYFLENQNYVDSQNLNNCKVTYSSSNPTSYSWSPSKTTLPSLPHLDAHNMMIPSTLPTLVGDLDKIFNNYDLLPKKYPAEDKTKRDTCKNFYKNDRIVNEYPKTNNEYTKSNTQSSFLSVTQLVDDKDRLDKFFSKNVAKNPKLMTAVDENCHFDTELNRDKCNYLRNKENYSIVKPPENTKYTSTAVTNVSCTTNTKNDTNEMKNQTIKCKSKELKYNVNRCLAKENKKDTRPVANQKPFNEYVPPQNNTTCDNVLNKGVNPLSNKNSNYSAESLISSSSHQNSCSSQNYFPYDNTNYANCSTNRRIEANEESLTNVGYYTNTNYVYPNNFQSFNNYGFSNQSYNNYPSQIQHSSLPQKKNQKDDAFNKQDTADWYKESFSTYNSIVPGDFANQKSEKCKQSFPTNKYNAQKNSTNNSNMHNPKYYNYNASALAGNSKSSCSFNTSHSFSLPTQQCSETLCVTPNYEMKSNRNSGLVNSTNVHQATSLTNFNLSAIFPEINDKVSEKKLTILYEVLVGR